MHPFGILASLFLVSSASAVILDSRQTGYPSCFLPCLQNFNPGSCVKTDYTCLCKNPQFIDGTAQCLYDKCSNPSDIAQAIKTSEQACLAAGVTLTSTYTPTQSRSNTGSTTSSVSTTVSSGNATITSGGTSSSTSSSSTPTSSKKNTATVLRIDSRSAAGVLGAAVLALVAL